MLQGNNKDDDDLLGQNSVHVDKMTLCHLFDFAWCKTMINESVLQRLKLEQ